MLDYKEEKYQWQEQYRLSQQVDTVPSEDVDKFLLAYHDGKLVQFVIGNQDFLVLEKK